MLYALNATGLHKCTYHRCKQNGIIWQEFYTSVAQFWSNGGDNIDNFIFHFLSQLKKVVQPQTGAYDKEKCHHNCYKYFLNRQEANYCAVRVNVSL